MLDEWEVCSYMMISSLRTLHNKAATYWSFPKKEVVIKKVWYFTIVCQKVHIHNLSAPHKRGILEIKEYYVHVIPSPTKCSQGDV